MGSGRTASLKSGEVSDIDAKYLYMKLLAREVADGSIWNDKSWTPIKIMEFAKKKMDTFPIIMVAYRMLLIVPVTDGSISRKKFFQIEIVKVLFLNLHDSR